jgi:hypothetical protein
MVHGIEIRRHQEEFTLLVGGLEIHRVDSKRVIHHPVFPGKGLVEAHAGLLEGFGVLFDQLNLVPVLISLEFHGKGRRSAGN